MIHKFYKDNPSKHVFYNLKSGPNSAYTYYATFENKTNEMVAITSTEAITEKLFVMHSSTVKEDKRGVGLGTAINCFAHEQAKIAGCKKIASYIYVDNLASIFMKLKMGYLIEGLLRDNEEQGKHEYILGLML